MNASQIFDKLFIPNIYFYLILGMLVKALESDWAVLAEEIGLWLPVEVTNEEHNDKPDGTEDSGKSFGNLVFPYFSMLKIIFMYLPSIRFSRGGSSSWQGPST